MVVHSKEDREVPASPTLMRNHNHLLMVFNLSYQTGTRRVATTRDLRVAPVSFHGQGRDIAREPCAGRMAFIIERAAAGDAHGPEFTSRQ